MFVTAVVVYNVGVRIRWARSVLIMAAALTVAGCGGGKASQAANAPPVKHNAGAYDTVDVCALPADAELQAALGETVGTRNARTDDSLKGCEVDGSSGRFYLFITVRRSPAGGQRQFDYDRSVALQPQKLGDIGGDAFSYTNSGEAHVEALDGDLVVRVSFVFYADGGTVSDGPELVGRISALLKHLVQRV
jgi:hypothetical protein